MNKTELIDAISTDTGLTRRQAESALDSVVFRVTSGVWGGSPVRITGFGTFKLRERAARLGRNPQTGAAVKIKASKGIGFTPGLGLKADLNAKRAPKKPVTVAAVPAQKAVAAKKSVAKTAPARKTVAAKKTVAKKAPARKTVAKKAPARKTVAAKAVAKKAPARKTVAKKAPARKTVAKKAPARKASSPAKR